MKKYISFDIGGTYLKYALLDQSSKILFKSKMKTPLNQIGLKNTLNYILDEYHSSINGIAISSPGQVDINTGTIYKGGSLPYLHGFPIKKYLESRYNIRTNVSNDGKAATIAEFWLGNLKGIENGAAVILGTGVGGGLILNGDLFQGDNFQAGEISFMLNTTDLTKEEPFMGFSGSAVRFINKASKRAGFKDLNDGEQVFKLLQNNSNMEIVELFDEYCNEIACILINLQAILDLSKIVIGGGISSQKLLITGIENRYNEIIQSKEYLKTTFTPLEIDTCAFNNDANLIGALYPLINEKN